MITPQEIRQTTFEKAMFGGYDMAGVDDFIDQLTVDYTALYKETNTLKQKMKVLVGTIEEYRRQQDAIQKELAEAKAASEKLIAETQAQCDYIKKNAQAEAMASVSHIRSDVTAEEDKLTRAKILTTNYIERMKQITLQHLKNLDDIGTGEVAPSVAVSAAKTAPIPPVVPVAPAPAPEPAPAEPEIMSDATRIMDFSPEDLPPLPGSDEAPAEAPSDAAPADTDGIFADILKAASGDRRTDSADPGSSKYEFINLQFGKDYDINGQ